MRLYRHIRTEFHYQAHGDVIKSSLIVDRMVTFDAGSLALRVKYPRQHFLYTHAVPISLEHRRCQKGQAGAIHSSSAIPGWPTITAPIKYTPSRVADRTTTRIHKRRITHQTSRAVVPESTHLSAEPNRRILYTTSSLLSTGYTRVHAHICSWN